MEISVESDKKDKNIGRNRTEVNASELSEEEKKAIRNLENLSEFGLSAVLNQADLDKMKIVLNLIEEQQKEIENSISKDKIREKMQEYYEKASPYDCDTADYKQSQEIGGFNALRKLLEE